MMKGKPMARRSTQRSSEAKLWKGFCARQKRIPAVSKNPLYALPVNLIDIITRMIPQLWTSEEVSFEQDLANTATGGFFHGRPFLCPFLPTPMTSKMEQADRSVKEMIEEQMQEFELNKLQIQFHLQTKREQEEAVKLRDLAYSTWLVMNTQFLSERDSFRAVLEESVVSTGCFPAPQLSFLGEQHEPVGYEEAHFLMFCRRWGLHTFLTWDVPVPLHAQLSGVMYYDSAVVAGAGLLLFMPWHLLRDGQFTLQNLVKQLREAQHPVHLDGWLTRADSAESKLG